MKRFKYILCISLLSILLAACSERESSSAKLVVGLSADYPPFEFYQSGELTGFDVELAKAVANELGLEVEFKEMAFNALIPAVQAGHIDMALSGLTKNEKRMKQVDFSDNYYTNEFALLALESTDSVAELKDFSGKIGAQLSSTMEVFAKEQIGSNRVVSLENNMALVEELKLKRVNAVLLEKAQAIAFSEKNKQFKVIVLESTGKGYAAVFKKGSSLVPEVNQAISNLKTTGQIADIKDKWVG